MTIFIKNKHTLQIEEFKFRCCIGKKGSTKNKKEGDKKTPAGKFKFKYLLYRKDRNKDLKTNLKKKGITNKMGWCNDPKSKYYNKLITFPFKFRAEKLWLKKKYLRYYFSN